MIKSLYAVSTAPGLFLLTLLVMSLGCDASSTQVSDGDSRPVATASPADDSSPSSGEARDQAATPTTSDTKGQPEAAAPSAEEASTSDAQESDRPATSNASRPDLPAIKAVTAEQWEEEKDNERRDKSFSEAYLFLMQVSLGEYASSRKTEDQKRLYEANKVAIEEIFDKAVRKHLAESPGSVAAHAKQARFEFAGSQEMVRRGRLRGGRDALPLLLKMAIDDHELRPHLDAIQDQARSWIAQAQE